MRINKYISLSFLFLVIVTSCVDEYWPEMDKYENLLVVDGMISNAPGPYTIKLSRSSNVNAPQIDPYSGCRIRFLDDLGNQEKLVELKDEPGTYITTTPGYKGIVGRKYMIDITTPDEEIYQSGFEEIFAPVGIDTVYASIEYRPHDILERDRVGYQFYLDSKVADSDTNFLLWKLEETWEYWSDFTIDFLYYGYFQEFANWDSLYKCWRTQNVTHIYTATTQNLSSPVIRNFPLHFVDTETKKLSVRYSLAVRQLSITPDAHFYWDNIKNQISDGGSLYTKQPFQVRSNVSNIENPDEPVLGYFLVAGESRKRIFVNPPVGVSFYYPRCEPNFDLRVLGFAPPSSWPIYLTSIEGRLAVGGDGCFDCTIYGGTTEKPAWWQYQ